MSFRKPGRDEAWDGFREMVERFEVPPRQLTDTDAPESRRYWEELHDACAEWYDRHSADSMMTSLVMQWYRFLDESTAERIAEKKEAEWKSA